MHEDDIDLITSSFTDKLVDFIDEHIPKKVIQQRGHDQPWFTNGLKTEINHKNRLHNKYRKHKSVPIFLLTKPNLIELRN